MIHLCNIVFSHSKYFRIKDEIMSQQISTDLLKELFDSFAKKPNRVKISSQAVFN